MRQSSRCGRCLDDSESAHSCPRTSLRSRFLRSRQALLRSEAPVNQGLEKRRTVGLVLGPLVLHFEVQVRSAPRALAKRERPQLPPSSSWPRLPRANLHRADAQPRQSFLSKDRRANKVSSLLLLHNNKSRETVDVHTSLAQHVNPMVSLQYSSIRSSFQTPLNARQRRQQDICTHALHFRKFSRIQRTIRMK